jgi:hypothetical protein
MRRLSHPWGKLFFSWSIDFVNCHDVIFEIYHVVENQSPSLAYRMVTSYTLAQVLQKNILNMIPHVRNAFEDTSPSVVCIPFVPDAEDALCLAQNEGKLVELGEEIGVRSGRGLFLSDRRRPGPTSACGSEAPVERRARSWRRQQVSSEIQCLEGSSLSRDRRGVAVPASGPPDARDIILAERGRRNTHQFADSYQSSNFGWGYYGTDNFRLVS